MSFPITCTACHKTFTISDEIFEKKVAGRVVTIKCKSCSAGIRVDGTKGGGSVAPPAPPAPAAVAATAAAAPQPAAAPASDPLWAVDYPDGQDREFTTAEVIVELERGVISGATLVWRDGMGEWLEVHQVPELAGELTKIENKKKAAAVAAAKAAAAAAGPVHKPRAPMPTVTGLAGLPGATGARLRQPSSAVATPLPKPRAQQPSTPELPKPRAQQPSSPELPKPRAQQPSWPMLPKPAPTPAPPPPLAAPAPPPPPAPLAAPTPLPTPPLPFAAPPAPRTPPTPTFDATPPLPASVAKVVSRPPQPQPAFPLSASPLVGLPSGPALVADHASVEWPEAKKKTPLIILGVVAAVAVIGGAIALLGGKDEAPPPSAPISALPPTPAAAPTPTPAATPATTPTTTQTGADTAAGSDPVATAPDRGATPGAGFAELFAAGARKAESKGATVAPTARFDAAATKVPLAQAASDAQACKQSGGPTGKVTVAVTFDPNGKVSSATISEEPFAGTPTGACISAALKRASIAPFSGLPGTVSKTFSIL